MIFEHFHIRDLEIVPRNLHINLGLRAQGTKWHVFRDLLKPLICENQLFLLVAATTWENVKSKYQPSSRAIDLAQGFMALNDESAHFLLSFSYKAQTLKETSLILTRKMLLPSTSTILLC